MSPVRRTTAAVLALLVAASLAAAVRVDLARADGDPASDYLLGQRVFFPFDVTYAPADKSRFTGLVAAANQQGFKIRVALIPDSYDLGSITVLWGKPRTYARFLGQELGFVYKQRLLVVMPNGYGFNWPGHSSTREYGVLASIPPPGSPAKLLDSATIAVKRLAAADGITISVAPKDVAAGGGQQSHTGVLVGAAAGALLLAAVLGGLALRRLRSARR